MKYLFGLILSLLLSGCSYSTYFKTESDPNIKFTRNDSIYVFDSENPSIEDKKMKILIINSLKDKGFKVNNQLPADYGLFFNIEERTYTNTSTSTIYMPQTSYTSGYVNGRYVHGQTTSNIPITDTSITKKTYKKIYYYLVNSIPNEQGKRNVEWTGFTSTEKDIYEINPKKRLN